MPRVTTVVKPVIEVSVECRVVGSSRTDHVKVHHSKRVVLVVLLHLRGLLSLELAELLLPVLLPAALLFGAHLLGIWRLGPGLLTASTLVAAAAATTAEKVTGMRGKLLNAMLWTGNLLRRSVGLGR